MLSFGVELELPDIDTSVELPEELGVYDKQDYTIVNNCGVANDNLKKYVLIGSEINTTPTDSVIGQIEIIEQIYKLFKTKTNHKSNLHIHVGVEGMIHDWRVIKDFQRYVNAYEDLVYRIIDPLPVPTSELMQERLKHVRKSHQTKLSKNAKGLIATARNHSQIRNALGVGRISRRAGINLKSMYSNGTIEFRQHAGSTDYAKVSNWVLFLQHFVEQSRKVKTASGPNAKYWAKKGSVAFAEVREQVENAGGQMKSNGNGTWNVTNARGNGLTKTNAQLFALYHSEFCRESGVTWRARRRWERLGFTPLKQDALAQFWAEVFGADAAQTVDTSLNAEVPAPVVEFFDNRRVELAA